MNKRTAGTILFGVLKKHWLYSASLTLIVVAVVGLSLLPPRILAYLIDNNLLPKNADGLLLISLLYFGAFALIGLFDFLKGLVLTVLGQKIVREIRGSMAEKLTRVRAGYFSANGGGTIASHLMVDVENINSLFSDGIISMLIDCFKIVGIVISIWVYSSQLGLFSLLLLPIVYGLTVFFRKRMLFSQTENLKEIGRVNNHIAETIKNNFMIRSFHKEEYMEENYKTTIKANFATLAKVNLYDSVYSPIIQMVTALATATIFLMASGGGSVFGLSIGMLAATIALITNLFAPVDSLGTELQSIQKGISGIVSVNNFFALDEDERHSEAEEGSLDIASLKRDGACLHFNNLFFAYETGEPILSGLDLQLEPRESICFVGRTGVGKTTLFKLMTGLLKPTEGALTLNKTNVYRIPSSQKREVFGYVEQHFSFVRGDVSQQISLGSERISQADVEAALTFVGLHDYVLKLDSGYKTDVSNGGLFSQGQKQLLSIARAIVTNPPILLLDEVTANLDSVTEDKVVAVLKNAGRDKTILSISHRISSVLTSDRVVLLEKGRIQAVGTPQEIINHSSWLQSSMELE